MTDQPNPDAGAGADETFTWTDEPAASAGAEGTEPAGGAPGETPEGGTESVGATATAAAVQVLEQLRDAIDELAERASPTVREYSARIAELAAFTADRTAPFLKRAGEATAEASGKLAERSRTWAADLRASAGAPGETEAPAPAATEAAATAAAEPAEPADPAGAFEAAEHGGGLSAGAEPQAPSTEGPGLT